MLIALITRKDKTINALSLKYVVYDIFWTNLYLNYVENLNSDTHHTV